MKITSALGLLALLCGSLAGAQPAAPANDAWPKQFEVVGPESASFGFAVTQPGPIAIEVNAQGPALRVELDGPARAAQVGQGRIALNYVATAADVERSVLWGVRITLATPGPTKVSGRVNVRSAAPDAGRVTAAVNMFQQNLRKQSQRGPQDKTAQLAQLEGTYSAHLAKSNRDLAEQRTTMQKNSQVTVDQLKAGGVTSRALPRADIGGQASATATATQSEQLAAAREEARKKPRFTPVDSPPPAPPPPPPPPPVQVPPPTITALSTTRGSPGQPPGILPTLVMITGSGFSDQPGEVRFLVNPGKELVAPTDWWSDGTIRAYVPDATGIVAFDGFVYVVRGGVKSAPVNFRFEPALETRTIVYTDDRVIGQPGRDYKVGNPRPGLAVGVHVIGHANENPFAGFKGNDEFFRNTQLKNGWLVDNAFLTLDEPRRGGAYIQEIRPGTSSPYMNVRYWVDACFGEMSGTRVGYLYMMVIRGPRGVPDGIVVR